MVAMAYTYNGKKWKMRVSAVSLEIFDFSTDMFIE